MEFSFVDWVDCDIMFFDLSDVLAIGVGVRRKQHVESIQHQVSMVILLALRWQVA